MNLLRDSATFADHARFALSNLAALTKRPDQVKQLRQTILNLAVLGRLVPQDPKDEPASALLKRIAAEKARLVKAGDFKKEKSIPPASGLPFEVPRGWAAATVRTLCKSVTDGDHLPPP